MNKKSKIFFIFLILSFSLFACILFPHFEKRMILKEKIKKEVTIEVGTIVTIHDLLNEQIEGVTTDRDLSTLNEVGEYTLKVIVDKEIFKVKISDC